MTLQIDDFVTYLNQRFALVWGFWLESYIRERYELEKHINIHSTSLYRGYFAEYEIQTGQLYLKTLHISASHSELKINGLSGEVVTVRVKHLTHNPGTYEDMPMWVKYSPLQERLDVSGYILIADSKTSFVHVQNCNRLLGITFINGQPKTVEDFSKEAALLRKQFGVKKGYTSAEQAEIEAFKKKVFKR